jgi:ribosomal-protein-alanine N-acetyltransferase
MSSNFANRFSWEKPDLDFPQIQELIDLERICFESNPWTESQIQSHIDIHHALIWKESSQIVSYLFFMMTAEEIEILRIGTHPNFFRRGFASQLIQILEHEFPHRNLFLEVEYNNEIAKSMYSKIGFKTLGERKNYYGEGRHAYIMKKEIFSPE